MANVSPDMSLEKIMQELAEQARSRWGENRAAAIQTPLEQTARQLHQISQNLPDPKVEPGFYQ